MLRLLTKENIVYKEYKVLCELCGAEFIDLQSIYGDPGCLWTHKVQYCVRCFRVYRLTKYCIVYGAAESIDSQSTVLCTVLQSLYID